MIRAMLAPDSASIPRVGDYIQVDSFRVADHPDTIAPTHFQLRCHWQLVR
jgi:hypothetical protein